MIPTHEHEIVDPVDLCQPDGRTLAREARGWSRRPLIVDDPQGTSITASWKERGDPARLELRVELSAEHELKDILGFAEESRSRW